MKKPLIFMLSLLIIVSPIVSSTPKYNEKIGGGDVISSSVSNTNNYYNVTQTITGTANRIFISNSSGHATTINNLSYTFPTNTLEWHGINKISGTTKVGLILNGSGSNALYNTPTMNLFGQSTSSYSENLLLAQFNDYSTLGGDGGNPYILVQTFNSSGALTGFNLIGIRNGAAMLQSLDGNYRHEKSGGSLGYVQADILYGNSAEITAISADTIEATTYIDGGLLVSADEISAGYYDGIAGDSDAYMTINFDGSVISPITNIGALATLFNGTYNATYAGFAYNMSPTSAMLDAIYGCAEGKILKRAGSVWECADDDGGNGATKYFLENNYFESSTAPTGNFTTIPITETGNYSLTCNLQVNGSSTAYAIRYAFSTPNFEFLEGSANYYISGTDTDLCDIKGIYTDCAPLTSAGTEISETVVNMRFQASGDEHISMTIYSEQAGSYASIRRFSECELNKIESEMWMP